MTIIRMFIMIYFLDDCGDHVVCINTKQIALPGDEWTKRGTIMIIDISFKSLLYLQFQLISIILDIHQVRHGH